MTEAPMTRSWVLDMRLCDKILSWASASTMRSLMSQRGAHHGDVHQRHRSAMAMIWRSADRNRYLRLVVTLPAQPTAGAPWRVGRMDQALLQRRRVWFAETAFVPTPIYARERLPLDVELRGPCIVEQMDTTTVVPPHATLRLDGLGCMHIELTPIEVHEEDMVWPTPSTR